MAGTDDSCPPAAPPAVQQTAPEGENRRGKPRTHDACNHKHHCRYCRRKEQGKCKRLPADCDACRDDHLAAGSSEGGSRYLLLPSPRAMRSQKKARVVEEEGQEEETEEQEDEEEEEGGKPRFSEEDIRDYSGEVERHQVFAAAFEALVPPEEGPLTDFWKQKLGGMERGIRELQVLYGILRRYFLLSSLLHCVDGGEGRGLGILSPFFPPF